MRTIGEQKLLQMSSRIGQPENYLETAPLGINRGVRMPIEIVVADEALAGLTVPAQVTVKQATEAYVTSLIREANRIEAATNGGSGPPEITHAMVETAVLVHKHTGAPRKTKLSTKVWQASGGALLFILGLMANLTNLQDKFYLLLFIVVLFVTGIVNSISIFRD